MVLGRKELSAILLAIAAVAFYMVLLSTTPSGAQTGGNEGCYNPEPVETFTGTENRRTPEFQITGTTFRLAWHIVRVTDPNGFPSLEADVLNDTGRPIGEGFLAFEEDGSENILAGPGTFSLEIRANDVSYEIVVEDCVGTDQNGGDTPKQTAQNRTIRDRDDSPRRERTREVINVPRRLLPPSGGASLPVYGVVGGFVLTGAGLLALGLVIRRGSQR